jgi:hypothetical protein
MLKTFFRFQPSYNILQVFKPIHIILLMIKPKQKEINEKTINLTYFLLLQSTSCLFSNVGYFYGETILLTHFLKIFLRKKEFTYFSHLSQIDTFNHLL